MTNTLKLKLKPCPFCGGTNLRFGGDDKDVGVRCLDCEVQGPNHYGEHEWNTRAAPSGSVPNWSNCDAAWNEAIEAAAEKARQAFVIDIGADLPDAICALKKDNPMTTQQKLQVLRTKHAEWSEATFGSVGPVGPAKHLSKEALEVAENPTDLQEYADCQLLLWDMQRRAGISDAAMADAIAVKLAINMSREWPAPKDGEPREHRKGQDND